MSIGLSELGVGAALSPLTQTPNSPKTFILRQMLLLVNLHNVLHTQLVRKLSPAPGPSSWAKGREVLEHLPVARATQVGSVTRAIEEGKVGRRLSGGFKVFITFVDGTLVL